MLTRFGKCHQVHADSLELSGWHRDSSGVLGLWDTKVLLVNIHQLEVILAQPVAIAALKDKVQHIRRVLSLDSEDILVLRRTENLGQRRKVNTKRDVAIASIWGKSLGLEHHRHERDVRVVHGLEGDTGVIAVEVAVLYQVFNGIDNLQKLVCIFVECNQPMLTFFSRFACSRRASSTG